MGKIAHLKVTCPQCGKYSSIYVEERGASAMVKCEHCKQIFEFGRGMLYEPVAYVPSIPPWAVISKADEGKVFSQAIQCKQCGQSYDESDVEIEAATSKGDYGLLDPSNPAFRKLLGLKSLMKCGHCSAIACSDCALESEGITKMRCPFCKTDYTIYSYIKPTEAVSGNGADKQQEKASSDSNIDVKTENVTQEKEIKNKRPTAITVICVLGFIGVALIFLLIFSGMAARIGNWYLPYATCLAIIGLVNMIGLWKMKKWAAYAYTGVMAFNQIVLLSVGLWNFKDFIIPVIVATIALANIKKMD